MILLGGFAADAGAQDFALAQSPMVVPSVLDPNLILTLEDSTNMRRAIAPDANYSAGNAAPANTRRFKSAAFNPLYYDPNFKYTIPPNAHSTVEGAYKQSNIATAFANAYVNGYYFSGNGNAAKIDLTSAYRPTLENDPMASSAYTSPGHIAADHAAADLGTGAGKLGTTSPTGATAAYYYIYDTTLSGCTASTSDDKCYRLVIVSATSGTGSTDERLNFLIWYSFYRTRYLAMIAAAATVMNDPSLSGFRLAWQGLNSCNSFASGNTCSGYSSSGSSVTGISNLISKFDDNRRQDLRRWLRGLGASGNVPLRTALQRAGEYYRSTSTSGNNPYLNLPQSAYDASTNPEYACRPNFHLLLASSAWDDTGSSYCSGAACGDKDGTAVSLPQSTINGTGTYAPAAPYRDGTPANQNSLADVAFHYWVTDLRSSLANNKMLPYYGNRTGTAAQQDANPTNDPAQWQHMVNFVVGVGLRAALGYGGVGTTPPANWGDTSASGTGRLFDLWHAAINSRGRFYGADTPGQIGDGLTESLARASLVKGAGSSFVGASLATNSTRLTTDAALYQAQFRVDDWTGRLAKIPIGADGALQCVVGGTPACVDAADKIPAADTRTIFTWSGTSGATFNQTGLTSAGAWSSFGTDDAARTAAVNYLRGDQSNEISKGGSLRNRSKVLGDIVDSDIVFAGGENYGYQSLCPDNYSDSTCVTFNDTYSAYVTAKQSRVRMVYVGANDGMLHGFNSDTMVEQFAYVPRAILTDTIAPADSRAALVQLSSPSYNGNHRFFVDGSPWTGDVCLKSPAVNCSVTDWRTVLIGTAGAGQKSVFALDVSNPSAVASSNVLWDLTAQSDVDLGNVIGQPVIGRLNDGNYYAIFGNGYLSARKCPVLYLVNIASGAIRRLSAATGNLGTGNSSTECAVSNGLGRPSLFDDPAISGSQRRTVDAIYVGDVRGNLWKFDVSSSDPTRWDVAIKSGSTRAPLFTARNKCGGVQPITGLIEIGVPPPGVARGAMLYFGTGRFLSPDDRTDLTRQTFYGLLDENATSSLNDPGASTGNTTACASPSTDVSDRGILQQQTLSSFSSTTDTFGNSVMARTLSATAIDYKATGSSTRRGWYIDLAANGERMVTAPTLLAGRVLFPTLIPSVEVCDGGGTSAIVAVDPYTGGKTAKNIFSVAAPVTYDSIQTEVGIVKNLIAVDSGTNVYLFAGGSSGNVQTVKTISQRQTGGSVRARSAWREVFQ